MARPLKNSCDYFPHDAGMRNHKKIKAIRNKFGITGYAIWSMILELLTGSDGNVFEDSPLELELISGDFGVSVTEIREVLNYCYTLELLFLKEGFVMSESLDERLLPVYLKRKVKKELSSKQKRNNGKFHSNSDNNGVSDTRNTDNIGNNTPETPQSKVNKSKVNNNNTETDFFDIIKVYKNKSYDSQSEKIKLAFSRDQYEGYIDFISKFEPYGTKISKMDFPLMNKYVDEFYGKFGPDEILSGIRKMISIGIKKEMDLCLRLIDCIGFAVKKEVSNGKTVVSTEQRLQSQKESIESAIAYQKSLEEND